MLTVSCSCALLVFLLCSSLHACNARRDIGVLVHKKQRNHKVSHDFHFFNKIQREILIPKEQPGDQSEEKQTRSQDPIKEDKMEGKALENDVKSHVDGSKKPRASVTWRVPHRKRGEKQPGFNLDYSPPKTHPPSHN